MHSNPFFPFSNGMVTYKEWLPKKRFADARGEGSNEEGIILKFNTISKNYQQRDRQQKQIEG